MSLEEMGGWPYLLGKLTRREDLSAREATSALDEILEGNASPAHIAAFLVGLRMKGETAEEIRGMVHAMLAKAQPVELAHDVVDTCGTGGSPQRRIATFNVSTVASFVVAGAGARVCKHGGRRASATSGSFDLLEALGARIDLDASGVARCVDEAGIGFIFAPNFHPAMRHAAPVRRELGIPTTFNFIAPLANPARPRRQVVGVSDARIAGAMLSVLEANGAIRAMIVHGHDGLDELTTTTGSTILELVDGETHTSEVDLDDLGLATVNPEAIHGGDAGVNADLARRVLDGEPGPHRDVVALNAAAGILVAGLADDLAGGLDLARKSIDAGSAASCLDRFVAVSKG